MSKSAVAVRWGILFFLSLGMGCKSCDSSSSSDGMDVHEDPASDVSDASDVLPDAGEDPDVTTDPDTETDPDPVGDTEVDEEVDTEVDTEVSPLPRNGCGGFGLLLYNEDEVEPGDACGAFGQGRLACSSLDSVRCLGGSERNVCGGFGVLPVELGTPCGLCDEGRWACTEDGDVACAGAQEPNGCGGCAGLSGRPGGRCAVENAPGTLVCTAPDALVCQPGLLNACGGDGVLQWDGDAAQPGSACATACGTDDGVLACAGEDALECFPTGRAVPANACGGCGPLPGVPDEDCGICGGGVWTCDGEGGAMVCEGTELVDACGGCSDDAALPGEACGDGRIWLCDGAELACVVGVDDPGDANACGGVEDLSGTPGAACGACESGALVCASFESLACVGDEPRNACGGCSDQVGGEADACGVCGTGTLQCDDEDLVCDGDAGEAAQNACGGCGALDAAPGDPCGACLAWTCTDLGGLRCEVDPGQEGCSTLLTCADLGCAAAHRQCVESDGEVDAACAGCLADYEEIDGTCLALLEAPASVEASQGTSTSHVEVTWAAVTAATGYHVYRDGVRITMEPVVGTSFVDPNASAGGAPSAVLGVSATEERTDGVEVSWEAGSSPVGATVPYQVRAVTDVQASGLSDAAAGFRGAFPVIGYEVQVGDGVWTSVGNATAWTDPGAPAGTVTVGLPTATDDLEDRVELAVVAASTTQGASQGYRVRALNAAGEGAASEDATGRRAVAEVTYQWQWAATQEGTFADLGGGAVRTTSDEDVPVGETRWYRVVVRAEGAEDATSGAVDGRRPLRCGDLEPPCASLQRVCEDGVGREDGACGGCVEGAEEDGTACATVDCGALPAPANGSVVTPSTLFASIAAYGCDEGYQLVGEGARVCLADGAWSGEPPVCNGLGSVCEEDEACPQNTWCPTATRERRCSPRATVGAVDFSMQWIPGGTLALGSPEAEVGRFANEAQVRVVLSRDTFVQTTPVTQGQWSAAMEAWNALPADRRTMHGWSGATPEFGVAPSYFGALGEGTCASAGCPVEQVSWWDAVVFANVLSLLEGLTPCYALTGCGSGTGQAGVGGGCGSGDTSCGSGTFACSDVSFVGLGCEGYRLPIEAEWERAARAETTTATYRGDLEGIDCSESIETLGDIAWYTCNSGEQTRPAGEKAPNAWGLHDMLGNVREWSSSWFATELSEGVDPLGPATGTTRVRRGGSWDRDAQAARAAFRGSTAPGFRSHSSGFRLARSAPVDPNVDCGALDPPLNGSVSAPETGFQSIAEYACDPGYVLVGNEERVCLSRGEWSGTAPWCSLAPCTSDDECPSGSWCPTDTSERRCSPRPEIGGVEMPFQWVPRGTFTMGSPSGEVGRLTNEAQVEVTLTRDYFVQRTPVTQGQWAAVMTAWNARASGERTMSGWSGATPLFGTNPSYFGTAGVNTCSTPTCPVERVSWWDAVVYANVLSVLEGLTPCYTLTGCGTSSGVAGVGGGCSGTSFGCSGDGSFSCSGVTFAGKSCSGYRLLTEAEWERAARGGTTMATYGGNLSGTLGCVTLSGGGGFASGTPFADLAWYSCNSGIRTQAVGQKAANSWGLYDMLGNVWESTWTRYAVAYSGGTDPLGPEAGSNRVHRGGSWNDPVWSARAATRTNGVPGLRARNGGLRLARSAL